jgi:hypothetical protein
VSEFDFAAEKSFELAHLFPNPPRGLVDANQEIHFGFTFQIQASSNHGFSVMPPQRIY